MWSYFVTHSKFSCLARLAEPCPLFGPTYMHQIPNLLHGIQNCAHEVLTSVYWAGVLSVFTLKPFALLIKGICFVFHPALLICSPSLLLML